MLTLLNAHNDAFTRLVADVTSTDTFFDVEDASKFPDPPFRVWINEEIIEVRAIDRVTNRFSELVRGVEGTTPAFHSIGSLVENVFTAGTYQELVNAINSKETTEGAQQKADVAEANAKEYAEQKAQQAENNAKAYTDNRINNHINNKNNPHNVTKSQVGLGNVDNVKQMPISGGTFTGIATAHSNTSYTTRQVRNIILSTANPNVSAMQDGDIWIKYR